MKTLPVLLAAAVLALAGCSSAKPTPAASSVPTVNGIAQPDPSCVQTTGTDHQDMWNNNGWWAGRVDGDVKQLPAFQVLSLKIGGHSIDSAWICAPHSGG